MVAAWAVVGATAGLLVALGVVLARQGSPGKLSEEQSTSRSLRPYVVDRPAGPDAEAMGVSRPGCSSTAPEQERQTTMSDETWRTNVPPSDERLADTDVEGLIEEDRPANVPDDERVVPEDVNEYVADDDESL